MNNLELLKRSREVVKYLESVVDKNPSVNIETQRKDCFSIPDGIIYSAPAMAIIDGNQLLSYNPTFNNIEMLNGKWESSNKFVYYEIEESELVNGDIIRFVNRYTGYSNAYYGIYIDKNVFYIDDEQLVQKERVIDIEYIWKVIEVIPVN